MEIICSNCIKIFNSYEVFLAEHYMTIYNIDKGSYYTFYCYNCINKIENFIESKPLVDIIQNKKIEENKKSNLKNPKISFELSNEEIEVIKMCKKNDERINAYFFFSGLNQIKSYKSQQIELIFNELWDSIN